MKSLPLPPEGDDSPSGTPGTLAVSPAEATAAANGAFAVRSEHGIIVVNADGIEATDADGLLLVKMRDRSILGFEGFSLPGVGRIGASLDRARKSAVRCVRGRGGRPRDCMPRVEAAIRELKRAGRTPTRTEIARLAYVPNYDREAWLSHDDWVEHAKAALEQCARREYQRTGRALADIIRDTI